jgi:ADP-ribosylglycohydrolase
MTFITEWHFSPHSPSAVNKYWGETARPAAKARLSPVVSTGPYFMGDGHIPDFLRDVRIHAELDQVITDGLVERERALLAQAVVLRAIVCAGNRTNEDCWRLMGYKFERTDQETCYLLPDLTEVKSESELRCPRQVPDRRSRLLGAFYGALVGDALGVGVEHQSRESIRAKPITGMTGGGFNGQPLGTFSDDSSLVLASLDVIRRGFSQTALLDAFSHWYYDGAYTADGTVFDIGNATLSALQRYRSDPTNLIAPPDEMSNGNGALMRILPIALWASNRSDADILDLTAQAAQVSHSHPRNIFSCQVYVGIASEMLRGADFYRAYGNAINLVSSTISRRLVCRADLGEGEPKEFLQESEVKHLIRILDGSILLEPEAAINSGGYVVHTLEAALWCLHRNGTFKEAVLAAVNLGEDTDTTASVVGGLAGLRDGYNAIPKEWISALRGRELAASIIDPFVERLLARGGWE